MESRKFDATNVLLNKLHNKIVVGVGLSLQDTFAKSAIFSTTIMKQNRFFIVKDVAFAESVAEKTFSIVILVVAVYQIL